MQYNADTLLIGLVVVIFTVCLLGSGLRILKQGERVAILRLGKFLKVAGPGIIWMTPILDKGITVSLKIQQTKIDTGEYVSSDDWKRRLTGFVNWRIIDAQRIVLSVQNHKESISNMIRQGIQKVGETYHGDTAFLDEESLFTDIHRELEPTLSNWGIEIVEIKLKSASEWD